MSCNNTSYISTAAKCFKNIELVTNICKFLNYEQQLHLLQVSRELKYIITNFVWNRKFKEVEVYAIPKPNTFLVSNKIDTDTKSFNRYTHMSDLSEIFQQKNLLFQSNEMEFFFNLNFSNIEKLHLKLCPDIKRSVLEFPLTHTFTNLTYLRYEMMTLTTQELKNMANNCLKLETLELINCFNLEGQPLILDQDLDIQVIKNMPNLKNLIVIFNGWHYTEHLFNFSNVKHILNQFKLQHLNLRFAIEPDIYAPEHNLTYENLKVCKVFEMGPCYQFEDFLYFQTNMLPNFENLSHLALNCYKGYNIITKEFFNILLKSCKNLTHLSLDNCCIENFVALPKLQELKLQKCYDLTWFNLKTILHDMHLKSFISFKTQYFGDAEYFLISDKLEKLQCDFWGDKLIGLLNFNKKNLKNLLHFNWINFCCPDCPLSLANFAPNLKVLYMQSRNLNLKDCFELKCLQKIALDLDGNIELLQLLKHDNLRELTIDDFYHPNPDVDFSQIRAFETKLQHLTVCREVLYALADFCLDLLQINGKLSLTCFGISCDLISKILDNEKFPSRFMRINICGFSIDCASIRQQCVETMDLIKLLVDTFQCPPEKCYFTLE